MEVHPRENPELRRELFAQIHQRQNPATEISTSAIGTKNAKISSMLSLREVCFNYLVSNIEHGDLCNQFNTVVIPTSLKVSTVIVLRAIIEFCTIHSKICLLR